MARPRKLIPSYRKHRASGQAIVTLGGRDFYLGPHGTKASKAEYDRLVAEWLASGRSRSYGASAGDLTVVELIADYLRYAAAYYGKSPRGEFANMKRAATPLKTLYGRTTAAEFGPQQLKALREKLVAEGNSRPYINTLIKRVVRIFRWAAGEGKLPPDVPSALSLVSSLRKGRTPARETAPVRPVDADLVEATLPHLSAVVRAMVEFQRLTGCRPGEVCGLRAGDIDRSAEVWEATLAEHKTAHHGRSRTLYVGPLAQGVITPYLLRADEAYCFSPTEAVEQLRRQRGERRQTPLSCGNRPGMNRKRKPSRSAGERYTTESYARAIRRACEQNGLKRWTPNQLRHLVATRVRRDFDLDAAKTVLGHSQVGTTEIYAEKDRLRAIEVARAIG
ncbi:MAG: site-specific integrase [Planctomycetota bacterium]